MIDKTSITEWFKDLQDRLCNGVEEIDGQGKFHQDLWEREGGGGGRTRVIEGGIVEKGGINFSAVHGPMPEKISRALGIAPGNFYATGVSLVLHPVSPMCPIIHMNVRYFEMDNGIYWFGGGIDLTPHYIDNRLAQAFHQHMKRACDTHHPDYYPIFKKWADDYFYLKHRKETRGIGGIFFDRLAGQDGFTKDRRFEFVKEVGNTFLPAYREQIEQTKNLPYGERQTEWQHIRRGRYVEFNLVWDKGTKFGLDTDGRTESILMSLPALASWKYNHKVEPGSPEEATLGLLKKDIDWVNG